MISWDKGSNDLFIRLFPIWIHIYIGPKFFNIEFGFINLCLSSTISVDDTVWDD